MNPKTKHTIVTGTGLLLLLSGFLFLPSPYTIIIALPVFLIGLLIIWSTKLKTKFKVLCTVLPIVLFVPYAQLVMYLYKNSMGPETKIDLIIDEEFHGKVVIVNNLDCPNTNEVGKRIKITIPKNGIAHYNDNPKISKMYTKVIEKSKTGKTKELNWFKLAKGEKGIVMEGGGGAVTVDGISYKLSVIEIGNEPSWELGITSKEEEIRQYIKKCKSEYY